MPERRLDAAVLRGWAHSAVDHLIRHADEINALNVFPVADADTGTNMLFTMRAALAEAESPHGGVDVADVSAALARGRLVGLSFQRAVARRVDEGRVRRIDLSFRARVEE